MLRQSQRVHLTLGYPAWVEFEDVATPAQVLLTEPAAGQTNAPLFQGRIVKSSPMQRAIH